MKKFKIKSQLAAGLSFRMEKLDAQMVVEAIGGDVEKAIRDNLKVVSKIEKDNGKFMSATKEIGDRKQAVFSELQKKWLEESKGKSDEELAKMKKELNDQLGVRLAEIQKDSKAVPDEVIEVEVSDDEYDKILKPVFKKTAGLWDTDGTGLGQRVFIEVADSINDVVDC